MNHEVLGSSGWCEPWSSLEYTNNKINMYLKSSIQTSSIDYNITVKIKAIYQFNIAKDIVTST